MAKKGRATKEKELRQNLTNSIVTRGLDEPVFRDRVEDYLFFSSRLTDLKEDMEENGLTEIDKYGNTVPRKVISEALKVSREMGKIYTELGLDIVVKTKRAPESDDAL